MDFQCKNISGIIKDVLSKAVATVDRSIFIGSDFPWCNTKGNKFKFIQKVWKLFDQQKSVYMYTSIS